jgi:ABC-2 type transport system permease protein
MTVLRLLGVSWWMQLKMRSRSAFDGFLSLLWPLFFATTIFLMFRAGNNAPRALLSAAVGSSVMGIWSATSTTASSALQQERRQGTLELLVATPAPFALVMAPLTLSMATVGAYSMVTTLLWGRFVFGIPLDIASPAAFVLGVLATVLAVGLLGFLLAVCSVRYRSAWSLGAQLELVVWLIGGFIIPVATFPAWVHPLSWALAPTWGMNAIRAATFGDAWALDALMCLALGAVYAAVGTYLAHRLLRSARQHASLALS